MTATTVTMMRPETIPTTTGTTLTRGTVGGKHKIMYSTHSQTCYTYMVVEELWWEGYWETRYSQMNNQQCEMILKR